VSKDATCGRDEEMKKGQKLESNWLFAQTTHVDIGPEILHAGSFPGSSYIFQVS